MGVAWSTYMQIEERRGVAACECPGNLLDAGRAFDSRALYVLGHKTSALSFLMSLFTVLCTLGAFKRSEYSPQFYSSINSTDYVFKLKHVPGSVAIVAGWLTG